MCLRLLLRRAQHLLTHMFFLLLSFRLQFAPAGVVRPGDVLQQHPHTSTGLQPACSALAHRLAPPTPGTPRPCPTHTSSCPPILSPSVPCSAFHDGDAVPLQTQPLKETRVFVCARACVCWSVRFVCLRVGVCK